MWFNVWHIQISTVKKKQPNPKPLLFEIKQTRLFFVSNFNEPIHNKCPIVEFDVLVTPDRKSH